MAHRATGQIPIQVPCITWIHPTTDNPLVHHKPRPHKSGAFLCPSRHIADLPPLLSGDTPFTLCELRYLTFQLV